MDSITNLVENSVIAAHIGAMDTSDLFKTLPKEGRIVVAMSGGVDSSTVAALLMEAGFDAVGITLQLYDYGQAKPTGSKTCCAGQDIMDARRVADSIGMPHYVLDYESRFKQQVIDDFADSYMAGETPIPCVRCNQTVKFRDLVQASRDLGAVGLVTGHYVQRSDGADGAELHRAADPGKDQSYFLFATTPDQLSYLHFPLGGLNKSETRAHAERLGLAIADKPDSQDICFVPNGDYASLVKKLRPGAIDPGDIVDLQGNVLGQHEGIIHFTIGQRRGLGISVGEPLYVIKLEPETRRVVVGPESALEETEVYIKDVNWLGAGDSPSRDGAEVQVKLRSLQEPVPARLFDAGNGNAVVRLNEPKIGVAPGQACVFYDGQRVLGGGWIVRKDVAQRAA